MLLKCAVAMLPKGIQYDIIVKDAQNVRLGASLTYFFELLPDSAKLRLNPLPKSPKIWYNRSIRKAEKQHRKGEEENA